MRDSRRRTQRYRTVGAVVGLLLLATACGDGGSPVAVDGDAVEPGTQTATGPGDPERFASLLAGAFDYEPSTSPRDLASRAEVVVEGTVVNIEKGRVYGQAVDAPGAVPTIVVEFSVKRVLQGQPGKADRVFVEFTGGAPQLVDLANEFKPVVAPAVLFLIAAAERSTDQFQIQNVGAGLPKGEKLWELAGAEGMLLTSSNGEVLQVRTGERFKAPIKAFEPTQDAWPNRVAAG